MGYVRQKWWMKLMSLFEEMKHKNMIPDIRPDPRKTKRKSCSGSGKSILCKIRDK